MLTGGGGRNLGSQKLVRKWFLPALACESFGRSEFPPPSFIVDFVANPPYLPFTPLYDHHFYLSGPLYDHFKK
jgi:hypothetical protein